MRLASSAVLALVATTSAAVQELPSIRPRAHFPVPNGPVLDLQQQDGILYAGGDFDRVGLFTGPFALLDLATAGVRSSGFPGIRGEVLDVVADGDGGWFVAGEFDQVGEELREGVVRIRADGTLDSWDPGVNGKVSALLLADGVLFLAGEFDLGQGARLWLAAVDANSGDLLSWNPAATAVGPFAFHGSDTILALEKSGGAVFIGGYFTQVSLGGGVRSHLAVVDAQEGLALAFDPSANHTVFDLLPVGKSLLVVGGFTSIGGEPRPGLAWLREGGVIGRTFPAPDGPVSAAALRGSTLFVGGDFSEVDGQPRERLAAIDLVSRALLPWAPAVAGFDGAGTSVDDLLVAGSSVIVAGAFQEIGGMSRRSLAQVDASSGSVQPWDSAVAGSPASTRVRTLALQGDELAAGGNLVVARSARREGAAAYELAGGRLLPWAPQARAVHSIAFVNGRILLGGTFTAVGGIQRPRLAAVDPVSGALDAGFDAGYCLNSGVVQELAFDGERLFAAGTCLAGCGQNCRQLDVLDPLSGAPSASWTTQTSSRVLDLELAPGAASLYLGGEFVEVGDPSQGFFPRRYLASLDAATGAVTGWNPDPSSTVVELLFARDRLLAGGHFLSLGGGLRRYLAELDPISGALAPWAPDPDGPVTELALGNGLLFAAGGFDSIGGQYLPGLAALDVATGVPHAWNPRPREGVLRMLWTPGRLVVAGGSAYARGVVANLCVFDLPSHTVEHPASSVAAPRTTSAPRLAEPTALFGWPGTAREARVPEQITWAEWSRRSGVAGKARLLGWILLESGAEQALELPPGVEGMAVRFPARRR